MDWENLELLKTRDLIALVSTRVWELYQHRGAMNKYVPLSSQKVNVFYIFAVREKLSYFLSLQFGRYVRFTGDKELSYTSFFHPGNTIILR